MEKFFYLDESPFYLNKYVIRLNHDKFLFPNGTMGSFNVFISRVLNLSYAQYLRYARDRLGAELMGKNTKYVVPYFPKTKEVDMFLKLLNKRMEYVMNEIKYPFDYKEDTEGNLVRIPFNSNQNEDNT